MIKFYQHIDFIPTMWIDEGSSDLEKREAWLEEVACAILNHTKEDRCLKPRQILELLVEANRIDLLPGQKGKYIPVGDLVGGAASKLRAAFTEDYLLFEHAAITRCSIFVPTSKFDEDNHGERITRPLDYYLFHVNPDNLRDLYKNGTLPSGKW